ncbi:hypothetical protein MGN01_05700 [Methylobacterium gnaphalii]|uniref:Secreted protein n=1 Tax=Methylobacterium gnaphalii TaxID=1010610 RepID=A0A512JFK6_9HYPH|nr:hypothetical protein MGN01_05700 [Methylobacterium gnaphalii]GLS47491.1 hypothetical protein GCM10007885_03350 [Methylobacterium gnaphalii]
MDITVAIAALATVPMIMARATAARPTIITATATKAVASLGKAVAPSGPAAFSHQAAPSTGADVMLIRCEAGVVSSLPVEGSLMEANATLSATTVFRVGD